MMTSTGATSVEWSDLSDSELIRQYRSFGFVSAFRELVKRYQTTLYRLVMGLAPSAADAEGLCEKCFLRAERSLAELDDPARFYPWLVTIARELSAEAQAGAADQPARPSPDIMPKQGLKSAVLDILASLPADDRLMLLLSELQGQSPTQVAAAIGLDDRAAVGKMIDSAKERFQAALAAASDADATPAPIEVARDAASDELAPGTILDRRYEIIRPIGRGGMGIVYRAHHLGIDRDVAIKLLLPAYTRIDELRRRFQREAVALGRLAHPNFVDVIDSGELGDGSEFIAMELLDGVALSDLLEHAGRIEPRRALHMIRHVLRGLARAHEQGIVHRDIKPANLVVIDHDGDPAFVKILDLGIAKLTESDDAERADTQITEAGIAFGTPRYLSPEQAIGRDADARSDLYSVTVSLFEMIAGRPPFRSPDNRNVLAMHVSKPPPKLADVLSDVKLPKRLQTILDRGLAKRPEERYQCAADYLEAIATVIDDDFVPAADPAADRSRALATTGKAEPAGAGALAATLPLRALRALPSWAIWLALLIAAVVTLWLVAT